MASATQILREEHRVILCAITLLESAVDRVSAGRPLPDGWRKELLDWLRTFADRNHHAKEEEYLFPALLEAGVPAEGGPVSVMLDEHTEGRALVRAMAEGDPTRWPEAARRYCQLLRNHIDKENGVLLPLAEMVLDTQAQARLAGEFDKVEAEQGRAASIEHAEAEVDRLAAALRG